jgi:diaminohydroxyphosphoribosylaminopyrimidine deaminase/5-amino-6-(5-phosphoribosylamino)uracil reductase
MSQPFSSDDDAHMKRALVLATRGEGAVEPNPMVGCVIARGRRVVAEGYHRRFGGPHAEIEALRACDYKARGATVYVTLEPCCHFGKTPPCTEALIEAGVSRVVFALRDPFPKVHGKGMRRLRSAGIRVDAGLRREEAIRLTAPYLKLQHTGRPWVILKWAQTLDGRIATRTGDSKWISSESSRRRVHRIRGRVDGILVGLQTVVRDDPELTCRGVRARRTATRIVLDPHLEIPAKSRLVQTAKSVPVLVVTSREAMQTRRAKSLEWAGVELLGVRTVRSLSRPPSDRPAGSRSHTSGSRRYTSRSRSHTGSVMGSNPETELNLGAMLDALGQRGMSNLLVEGGAWTLGSFLDEELADEAMVFVSRRLLGGADAVAALGGRGPARIADAIEPARVERTRCGTDDVYRLLLTDPVARFGAG